MEKDEIINFLNGIMNNNTPTPRTIKFDRDFGQESNRWWDKIEEDNEKYSSQKYHIHGTFLCVTHHDWKIPKKCKKVVLSVIEKMVVILRTMNCLGKE